MSSNKVVVPFLLITVLLLCLDYNNKVEAQSQCCTEHYELGKCIPGVDDKNPSGNCWKYCMDNCDEQKGGFCKKNGNKHHCHCYC
ncbi:defensin protein [Salix suchowensis]|nr:defensin protein [Salix suchowensis]